MVWQKPEKIMPGDLFIFKDDAELVIWRVAKVRPKDGKIFDFDASSARVLSVVYLASSKATTKLGVFAMMANKSTFGPMSDWAAIQLLFDGP